MHASSVPKRLLVVAALGWMGLAPPARAQPISFQSHLGGAAKKGDGNAFVSVGVPAGGIAAGVTLVLAFSMDSLTGAVSCSDDKGNLYTVDSDVGATGFANAVRVVVCSSTLTTPLAQFDLITVTHPAGTSARAVSIDAFSGVDATSVDRVVAATGTGTLAHSGISAVTSDPDELLFAVVGTEAPIETFVDAGPGFTALTARGTTGGSSASNVAVHPAFAVVGGTGAFAASGTISSPENWAATLVTYRARSALADAGVGTDGGSADGGALLDAGVGEGDAGTADAGAADAGGVDGGSTDAGGAPDAGSAPDGGPGADGGSVGDGGIVPDAGVDLDGGVIADGGDAPDAGASSNGAEVGLEGEPPVAVGLQVGCGCAAGGVTSDVWLAVAGLLLAASRRRRRR